MNQRHLSQCHSKVRLYRCISDILVPASNFEDDRDPLFSQNELSSLIPCFFDHFLLVSDFRQLPCWDFLKFFSHSFSTAAFASGICWCLRCRGEFKPLQQCDLDVCIQLLPALVSCIRPHQQHKRFFRFPVLRCVFHCYRHFARHCCCIVTSNLLRAALAAKDCCQDLRRFEGGVAWYLGTLGNQAGEDEIDNIDDFVGKLNAYLVSFTTDAPNRIVRNSGEGNGRPEAGEVPVRCWEAHQALTVLAPQWMKLVLTMLGDWSRNREYWRLGTQWLTFVELIFPRATALRECFEALDLEQSFSLQKRGEWISPSLNLICKRWSVIVAVVRPEHAIELCFRLSWEVQPMHASWRADSGRCASAMALTSGCRSGTHHASCCVGDRKEARRRCKLPIFASDEREIWRWVMHPHGPIQTCKETRPEQLNRQKQTTSSDSIRRGWADSDLAWYALMAT